MAKQRNYSTEFKRQVVLECLAGETLYGLSKRHDVSRNGIRLACPEAWSDLTAWAGAGPLLNSGNLAEYEASWSQTKKPAIGEEYQTAAARIGESPVCVGALAIHGDAGRMLSGSFRSYFRIVA